MEYFTVSIQFVGSYSYACWIHRGAKGHASWREYFEDAKKPGHNFHTRLLNKLI